MKVISKQEQKTTAWSGGTTTELYLYPENANFQDRTFDFRISTATVEIDESTFTPLPTFNRILMVLEGKMELNHKNHHSCILNPLEQDAFQGAWITESKGKCTDFNLIYSDNYSGKVVGLQLNKEADHLEAFSGDFHFLYLNKGNLVVNTISITEGDFLVLEGSTDTIKISAKTDAQCALISLLRLP